MSLVHQIFITSYVRYGEPNSILSGAYFLMVDTDKSKQATMPGGDEGSEEKQVRVGCQADVSATLDQVVREGFPKQWHWTMA